MLPSCSGILAEAITIASTSLQQRQSIPLASFSQCPHFRNSRPEWRPATLFKMRTPFFTEDPQWLRLAFGPIETFHSTAACKISAAQA